MPNESKGLAQLQAEQPKPGEPLELSKKRWLARAGVFAGALTLAATAATAKPNTAQAHPDASPNLDLSQTYQPKIFGVFEGGRLDLAKEAGFLTVEKDLWVTPGHRSLKELPQADQDNFRDYTSRARNNGQEVFLNLWQVGWPIHGQQYIPPNRPHQWRDMCDVGIDAIQTEQNDAQAANQNPAIRAIIIGVEPNSKHFWKTQANAGMVYENWLATCYDRIKGRFPDMQVYGGSLASRADPGGTGPEAFIGEMCQEYKDSGRSEPIMDGFDMHDYGNDPPTMAHPNTDVITVADGDKLERDLSCFSAPEGDQMPVVWGEIGDETQIPSYQSYRYTGSETNSSTLDEITQGNYYAKTVQIISRQPYSIGGFFFHLIDDPNLRGWQSGLYYANAKRSVAGVGGYPDAAKKSLPIVQKAIQAAELNNH